MRSEQQTKAQQGLAMLTAAIAEFVACEPNGVRDDEVARELGLQSSFQGGQRNYLTHSILNALVETGALTREKRGIRVYYVCQSDPYAQIST